MFKTAKRLEENNYTIEYEINKKVEKMRIPKTYVCPVCLTQAKKRTISPSLQRIIANKMVIGKKKKTKLAVCSVCGYWRKKVDNRKVTWSNMEKKGEK